MYIGREGDTVQSEEAKTAETGSYRIVDYTVNCTANFDKTLENVSDGGTDIKTPRNHVAEMEENKMEKTRSCYSTLIHFYFAEISSYV